MKKRVDLVSMRDEDFERFLDKSLVSLSSSSFGLWLDFEVEEYPIGVEIYLTNYDIYKEWKGTDSYSESFAGVDEDVKEEFEEFLEKDDADKRRRFDSVLEFYGENVEILESLNEDLLHFYDLNCEIIDKKAIKDNISYIQDNINEKLEENL